MYRYYTPVVCIWKFETEKFASICKLNLKIHEGERVYENYGKILEFRNSEIRNLREKNLRKLKI